jgi:hypothetical protein
MSGRSVVGRHVYITVSQPSRVSQSIRSRRWEYACCRVHDSCIWVVCQSVKLWEFGRYDETEAPRGVSLTFRSSRPATTSYPPSQPHLVLMRYAEWAVRDTIRRDFASHRFRRPLIRETLFWVLHDAIEEIPLLRVLLPDSASGAERHCTGRVDGIRRNAAGDRRLVARLFTNPAGSSQLMRHAHTQKIRMIRLSNRSWQV